MTSFQLRRIEIKEGQEAMLLEVGWIFIGPTRHKDTELGKYWINPRSGMKYTKQAAVDIEELREAGDYSTAGTTNDAKTCIFKRIEGARYNRKKRRSEGNSATKKVSVAANSVLPRD